MPLAYQIHMLFRLMAACVLVVCSPAPAAEPLRVMSFNIRFGSADDGDNHWEKRKELVVETIEQFAPDLLGTQETLKFQGEYLEEQLKDYAYFGRSRMKTPNEQCGIFYRRDRFTWLAGGHFWLSETPEIPESKSWDSSLPRMASWVLLRDKTADGMPPVLLLNTHFDHRGSAARTASARLLRERIRRLACIAQDVHIVVTGDFNTGEGTPPYEALLTGDEVLRDTYRIVHEEQSETEGTFNGWREGPNSGARIAYCFVKPSQDFILNLRSTLCQFTKHTNRQDIDGKTAKRINQLAIS